MSGGVITNHGTPVNSNDVVNKSYVDSLSSGIPTVTVTLTGTAYTTILAQQYGDFYISVKNLVSNGPSATFIINKSEASRETTYTRFSSSAGLGTMERLDLRWLPNSGVELRKTNTGYDGQYRVQYILN